MALPDFTTQDAATYKANIDKSAARTGALVYRTTTQSFATGVWAAVGFDNESYDDDSIHDNVTNNSRLTVPTGVTKVKLTSRITFALNSTGDRATEILKNGLPFIGTPQLLIPAPAIAPGMSLVTPVLTVVAGDYFEVWGRQTSGGNLGLLGSAGNGIWFCMEIVG